MPRRNIVFTKGCYYHIYNRGARRVSIFREERNYPYLVGLMRRVASECQVTIIAYCLLPNHYHWLVRQDANIPAGILPKRVFGSYSQAYNRAYRESGTLFQGHYCTRLVGTERYLRHLCRYIHANPVKHGIARTLEAWSHSNYLDWVGQRSGGLLDTAFIREHFGSAAEYAAFVKEYLDGRTLLSRELQRFSDELEQ